MAGTPSTAKKLPVTAWARMNSVSAPSAFIRRLEISAAPQRPARLRSAVAKLFVEQVGEVVDRG
jgi:hypothetical protein